MKKIKNFLKKAPKNDGGINIPEINIGSEINKLEKLNIMVCGKTGVGKSTLISSIFTDDKIETGVGLPVTTGIDEYTRDGMPLSIFDCPGFELDNQQREDIMNRIRSTVKKHNIHCIWYCINVMASKIEMPEAESIKKLQSITIPNGENGYKNLPVVIVLTQAYAEDRTKGLKDVIIDKCGLKSISMVDIIAKDDNIGGRKIKKRNLDTLIDVTVKKMPENVQKTFIAMQMVNIRQKQKKSNEIITITALSAFATGAVPLPFADAPIIAAAQVAMITKITVIYGFDINNGTLVALVSSALGAGGATILGKEIVAWLLKMTGCGSVLGGAISGLTAMIITVALGEAYISLMNLVFAGKLKIEDLAGKKGQKIFVELFKKALKNKDKSKILSQIKEKLKISK